ncbi:hypothetical protein AGABI2DRAFT_139832 [Agaricus bisporus var. bisporus H97]|uniref:hypothetical protein n=1 Tax=Agaricus bisporus var. bisporus (strain H97 / ATCC MYA-4626 / FGSC 10389) TaxID=936046 RepID=UPI00029F5848|nr:hypothetical protein AGABI2DRAFT_139832 [Agaricus bisporus var. bisporus H97]EKV41890.1 hypothetical protein AGABI2DRAFT_139832 [Agaricus bisporus var. bisporus H97]
MLWTVWSFDVAPRSHDIMVTAMEVFATRWKKNSYDDSLEPVLSQMQHGDCTAIVVCVRHHDG